MRRLLLALALASSATSTQQRTLDEAESVARWRDAVARHDPGAKDESLAWLGDLSPTGWATLNFGLHKDFVRSEDGWPADVVRRAAMLHTDAALFNKIVPVGAGLGWSTGRPTRMAATSDSRYVGDIDANWNWTFARFLVDQFAHKKPQDQFVASWYHATAAALLRNGALGEARTHLDTATALKPRDALVHFDRGSLFEVLGLPRSQLAAEDLRVRAAASGPTQTAVPGQPPRVGTMPGIPREKEANAEAEREFRRALSLAPTVVEAQVRLGRLLLVRDHAREAFAELEPALNNASIHDDRALAYYAYLFGSRALRKLGRLPDAADYLEKALGLFPDAQSGLLAQSALALAKGDSAAALAPVRRLPAGMNTEPASDPWGVYHLAAGRKADELLRTLWEASRQARN